MAEPDCSFLKSVVLLGSAARRGDVDIAAQKLGLMGRIPTSGRRAQPCRFGPYRRPLTATRCRAHQPLES